MSTVIDKIKERYFRKVIAYPDGAVVHYGDCSFYVNCICTCGLHIDLMSLSEEEINKVYPKYWEEREKSNEYNKNN